MAQVDIRTSPAKAGAVARFAWVPVPLLFGVIAVLWALGAQTPYESRLLLEILNFIFSTAASVLVAILLGRSFHASGRPGMLLLGCGVVMWGAAGTIAPLLLSRGDNVTITVHNALVWLSAICQLAGVLLSIKGPGPLRMSGLALAVGYVGAVCVAWLVVVLALEGKTPRFFTQGQGGTSVRAFVLGSAIVMFAFTAVGLWLTNRPARSAFVRWYGLAMLLVATGLFGIMVERVHGGPLSWAGRSAQFLGGAYMFVAAFAVVKENRVWRLPLEEAVRESEQRYRQLFESMTEGFALHEIILDDDGRPCDYRFLDVNPAFEKLTGLKREALVGRRVREVLPTTEPHWIENYGKVALSGQPMHFENFSAALGRWYEVFAYRPSAGQFAVIFTEITQRRQAEAALRQALARAEEGERTLAVLMENIPEGITLCDAAGRLRMVSRRGQELLGGAHAGKSIEQVAADWRIYHADGTTPMAHEELPLVRAMQSGQMVGDIELVQISARGEKLPLLCNAAPIRDTEGRIIGAVVAWRDISERKRAEEDLERTRSTLTEAQKIAHLGSFEYVADTRATVWSEEEYRIYGLDPAGPSPAYDVMLAKCIHPDDAARLHEAFTQAMRSRSIYELEHRIVRPDGSVRWVYDRAQPYFDEKGNLLRYVGATLDITERRQTEEQLRARNADLTEFNSLMVDRELRMLELKKEVNELCRQAGQPPRYTVDGEEEAV